jgi:hypothetical protein
VGWSPGVIGGGFGWNAGVIGGGVGPSTGVIGGGIGWSLALTLSAPPVTPLSFTAGRSLALGFLAFFINWPPSAAFDEGRLPAVADGLCSDSRHPRRHRRDLGG